MTQKKLDRPKALEAYLVYQIRLYEYLHCIQIFEDIKDGKYKPESRFGHGPTELSETLRTMIYGLFASLMDKQKKALDVFDVWVVLYPKREIKIIEVRKKIEPHIQLIRRFRNDVACHANKNLREYVGTRRLIDRERNEINAAMQDFCGLAAQLITEQDEAFPDFRTAIDPHLRKAVPDASDGDIERLKDFFIQNKPAKSS
jgi:hypothetical protein